MDINLELYKVFYYVATTLSFSEASPSLQSARRSKTWRKNWATPCSFEAPNG